MTDVACFVIEPTRTYSVYARRYVSGIACLATGTDEHDPDRATGIHNAMRLYAIGAGEAPSSGAPDESQRISLIWPTSCAHCDYRFQEGDTWQVLHRTRYARADRDGAEFDLEDAPVGAMYRAEWFEVSKAMRGPDGESWVVVLPNGAGPWCMDGPSSDGKHWTRTGTPPKLTVTPSIGGHPNGAGGWLYHGWLKDGVLSDA